MEIDKLKKLIEEERRKVVAAKRRRNATVTLIFIGLYLLFFYFLSDKLENFNDYVSLFISALITGIMHHAINDYVYEKLHTKNNDERWYLKQLQNELSEKERNLFEHRIAEAKRKMQQEQHG